MGRWLCVVILLAELCSACQNQTMYNEFRVIDRSVWEADVAYPFEFEVADTTKAYDLSFVIRNTRDYPYQNFWLFYTLQNPAFELANDTLECYLADDYGKWLGDGFSVFESTFTLKTGYRFTKTGTHILYLRQGMTDETLAGVRDVGVVIAESNP